MTETDHAERAGKADWTVFALRVAAALVQAALLYWLIEATEKPLSWPATDRLTFEPMLLVAVFSPMVLLLGAGQMRAVPLMVWCVVASGLVAWIVHHDAARLRVPDYPTEDALWPWFRVCLALPVMLFAAQVLATDIVAERRLFPSYARHFDTAWKHGLQVLLTAGFVGLFWALLWMGAVLFGLLDLDFLQRLIEHRWFAIPATTLAIASSLHLTDVKPALIRGARSLVLTLLSWLLPLLVVIVVGFLASLAVVSVAPLWKTKFATALLLGVAAALIFLINCCYQDGAAERTASRVKRLAGSVGALTLLPLIGLAAWALSLRVGQYGWTVDRISAAAVTGILACYALGYATAVIRARSWLKRLEATNVVAAVLGIGVGVALFTPIADPSRLMVADQLARLESGTVKPAQFDFIALKFDGARWGAEALARLGKVEAGTEADVVRAKALVALTRTSRYAWDFADPSERAALVEVYPEGRRLPPIFYDTATGPLASATCFRQVPGRRDGELGGPIRIVGQAATSNQFYATEPKCFARFVSFRPDRAEAIIVLAGYGHSGLFEQDDTGVWRMTAALDVSVCKDLRDRLRRDEVSFEPPVLPDLVVGGRRIALKDVKPAC